jgi:hypothetical protein
MDYTKKEYNIITDKVNEETKIVTISDLHWNESLQIDDINNLIVNINDILPKYVFILGDLCSFNNFYNHEFKEKFLHFFKLLKSITNTYVIFGNHDYLENELSKKYFLNIEKLIDFYDHLGINVLNNTVFKDNNLNIIGFNKTPINYELEFKNTKKLEEQLKNLLDKINTLLDKEKYTILLTHSHLDLLKLEKDLFEMVDLILSGQTHNGLIPDFLENVFPNTTSIFFKNTKENIINDKPQIIVNGGITKISDSHSTIIKSLTKSLYKKEIDIINIKNE